MSVRRGSSVAAQAVSLTCAGLLMAWTGALRGADDAATPAAARQVDRAGEVKEPERGPERAALLERGLAREVAADRLAVEVEGVRGTFSGDEENEDEESDPRFTPLLPQLRGEEEGAGEGGGMETRASGATGAVPLHEHPKAEQMLQGIVNGLRDKEVNVALLGQHKYMVHDCLGLKVSVGEFTMKLGTPAAKYEGGDLVLQFAVDEVSMSAFRLRFRPNPTNLAKPCSFSKRIEVGGTAKDVRVEMRLDLSLDVDRCRLSDIGDVRVLARVGKLNLKPLQNDLDKVAKNMIEDALTVSLQLMTGGGSLAEGMGVSDTTILNDIIRAVDQVLEADCPERQIERAGELARTGAAARRGGKAAEERVAGVLGAPGARAEAAAPAGDGAAAIGDGAGSAAAGGGATPADYRVAEIDSETGMITAGDARGGGRRVTFRLVDPGLLKSIKVGDWVNVGVQGKMLHLAVPIQDITVSRQADGEGAVARVGTDAGATRPAAGGEAAAGQKKEYTLAPNPELTGRLGRLVIAFPEGSEPSGTRTDVYRSDDAEKQKRAAGFFGSGQAELLPGRYTVIISSKPVEGVEVRSGHETRVYVGVLRLRADAKTRVDVFEPGAEDALTGQFGSGDVGFPKGDLEVEVAGQREKVTIEEAKVTEF